MMFVSRCLVLLLVLTFCVATGTLGASYVEQYEMDFSPDTVAGTLAGNVLSVGDAGSGSTFSNGIMRFTDNTSSGNYGFYTQQNPTLLNNGNFTIDFRVLVISGVDGGAERRSMGFSAAEGQGRNLRLNTGSAQFSGNGGVGDEAMIDLADGWQNLRVIVDGSSNTISLYRLGGSLLTTASMGGSGLPDPGVWYGPAFMLGSQSGGGTTNTVFDLDWVRVAHGTDPDAVYAAVPEPSSLMLLAGSLVGAAGMIRRRRAA